MLLTDKLLERRSFARGTKIFSQGDRGDAAYVVESGRIAIYKHLEDRKVHLATMTKGALFGEMAVIDGSSRMASAVALEASVLVRIPAGVVEQKMTKTDPFIKALINILMDNLRNVHKVYVARPRSVQDFIRLLSDSSSIVKQYTNVVDINQFSVDMAKKLDQLTVLIEEIRVLSEQCPDRRASNFPDSDALPD
ncbi:MAG: cyclic nucleotide-binding domain-containing protein [Alphaproteobacteria bacterium]|nr:cyclic nucleotide-binding domain-containing protein [Alphaproteobacteria bacterium]